MEVTGNEHNPGESRHPWVITRNLDLLTPELHDFSDLNDCARQPRSSLRWIVAVVVLLTVWHLVDMSSAPLSEARSDPTPTAREASSVVMR